MGYRAITTKLSVMQDINFKSSTISCGKKARIRAAPRNPIAVALQSNEHAMGHFVIINSLTPTKRLPFSYWRTISQKVRMMLQPNFMLLTLPTFHDHCLKQRCRKEAARFYLATLNLRPDLSLQFFCHICTHCHSDWSKLSAGCTLGLS